MSPLRKLILWLRLKLPVRCTCCQRRFRHAALAFGADYGATYVCQECHQQFGGWIDTAAKETP